MSAGKNLLSKTRNNCIAVIGDGAITGGMAYEAMNNAAYINTRVIVILNDNGQVDSSSNRSHVTPDVIYLPLYHITNSYISHPHILRLCDNHGQVSLPTGPPSAGGVVPAGAFSAYTSRLLTSTRLVL